ncbi:MAG: efflux RND transporter periplasmic adaptor subunit [Bacteroidia bacterium]|jgi:multidrug efflux pump subunit AcrA (membrane-fusion protein)|nr:efflux RND transporter periplasmic adaptor subunit [Bacteroidia bacterium]
MKKYFLLLLFPLFLLASCGGSKDQVYAQRRDLTQAVYASGKLYPKNDYKVFARLPGYVQEIHVRVGDTVRVGDPLITIRSEVSEINVEVAKNQYDLARNNASESGPLINTLVKDVDAARAKYLLDSTTATRYGNLLAQNATSKQQADQAQTQFEMSRAALLKAQSNLQNTRARLRTESENARLQFDAQTSNRSDYVITAAVAGRVYDVVSKVGELVNTQQSLFEIGDATNFEVELSVDETDVSLLKFNQQVVYAIDAYENTAFSGVLTEVYPRISAGNKTARVIGSIAVPDNIQVFAGLSVEANIVIAERKNVLVIPREYLQPGSTVRIKGSEQPVPVKTGVSDLQFVEIVSGLNEKDELIK